MERQERQLATYALLNMWTGSRKIHRMQSIAPDLQTLKRTKDCSNLRIHLTMKSNLDLNLNLSLHPGKPVGITKNPTNEIPRMYHGMDRKKKYRTITVSYTHLDVYKRQIFVQYFVCNILYT